MFNSSMATPAIPERVFTLCKIVEKRPISNSELKERMEPSFLHNGDTYYSKYKNVAEELKLISTSDNMISLAVEPSIIRTIGNMRRYINGKLEQFKDGQFYKVTNSYFLLGSSVLEMKTNISEMAPLMSEKTNLEIDVTNMRAWRFWSTFLGFGYLQNMFFIPNADVFLKDLIEMNNFEKKKRYSFGSFIEKIRPHCNIIIDTNPSSRELNYGVSNGLRVLHDTGYIKLEHILDQEDIWSLYPLSVHDISSTVTNITFLK